MLPCVCSVIDHRWRQNVVRTNKWHTRRSRVCHWCSYHILTSSVIYYWITSTATWNLFVLYNNEKPFFYFKIFQHNAKGSLLPRLCTKKAIWCDLWSFQNEAISLVPVRSKDLWLVEKNRATVKPDSSVAPCWMKTYSESRIQWTAKSTNLEENPGKIKSVFVFGAALWAEKLGHCLENCRSWKNTLGKVVVTVKLEAIWFEFWMKGA